MIGWGVRAFMAGTDGCRGFQVKSSQVKVKPKLQKPLMASLTLPHVRHEAIQNCSATMACIDLQVTLQTYEQITMLRHNLL